MAGQWGGGKKFKFFWKETQFFLDTLYMAGPSEGQGSQLPPDSANKTVNQPRDTPPAHSTQTTRGQNRNNARAYELRGSVAQENLEELRLKCMVELDGSML